MFNKGTFLKEIQKTYDKVLEKYPDAKLTQINGKEYFTASMPRQNLNTLFIIETKNIMGERTMSLFPGANHAEEYFSVIDSENLTMPRKSDISIILKKLAKEKPELYTELVNFIAGD